MWVERLAAFPFFLSQVLCQDFHWVPTNVYNGITGLERLDRREGIWQATRRPGSPPPRSAKLPPYMDEAIRPLPLHVLVPQAVHKYVPKQISDVICEETTPGRRSQTPHAFKQCIDST